MIKTHPILSDEDIQNVETVKTYLQKSFRKRKAKKSNKLYINLCNIYNFHPNLVNEILSNVKTLGYYKDYFHILSFSSNYQLNNYIYNIVIDQIRIDVVNLESNKNISTLGKWLPSEGSKINRKINFIDKFAALFWGTEKNKFTLRKQYRLMKTKLNQKLGTLESLMNTKQYDKINLNKASHHALVRHKHHLISHEGLPQKFNEFELNKVRKMNLFGFMRELFENSSDIGVLEKVWEEQNYQISYLSALIENVVCVIDLSNEMFTNKTHYLSVGIALLVNKLSKHKDIIVCNNNIITFDKDTTLLDKKNKLMRYSGPCKDIKASDYTNIIDSKDDYILLFVTNKKITVDIKHRVLQIIPYHSNNYDAIMTTNGQYKKVTKYEWTERETIRESIKSIVDNSVELKDNTYLYTIFGLLIFWICLQIYGSICIWKK
jgi:hypothetical protein